MITLLQTRAGFGNRVRPIRRARLLVTTVAGIFAMGCDLISPDNSLNDGPAPDILIGNSVEVGRIEHAPRIRGRVGGHSVEFDGRSVWAFGDTFLDQGDADGLIVHGSSMSWTEDADAGNSISDFDQRLDTAGVPRRFLPLTDAERTFNLAHDGGGCEEDPCGARVAMRPGAMVFDEARNRVLVFYQKLYVEPGQDTFESRGASVAVWDTFEADPVRPEIGAQNDPTLLFTADEPWYGAAAFIVGETVYVYGIDSADDDKPCTVARVPALDVLDRSAWRFRNGDGEWRAEIDDAEAIFGANDIMHVSFNANLDSYVAVYSEPSGNDVKIRVSASLDGPWSRARTLFTARTPLAEDETVSDALPHPEFSENDGRDMYISYSRTTGFLESELRLVKIGVQPDSG